jgi:hypothetical protein
MKAGIMVETQTLLDRLLHPAECYDAVPDWELLCRERPEDGAAIAWDYLMRVEPRRSDPGIDAVAVHLFLESTKAEGAERIEREWPRLSESQKHAICRGAYVAEAMPSELALRLFHARGSGVSERHLLLAGLASTAVARHCEGIVFSLVDKVGTYPADLEHRQSSLNGLIEDIKRTFAPARAVRAESAKLGQNVPESVN